VVRGAYRDPREGCAYYAWSINCPIYIYPTTPGHQLCTIYGTFPNLLREIIHFVDEAGGDQGRWVPEWFEGRIAHFHQLSYLYLPNHPRTSAMYNIWNFIRSPLEPKRNFRTFSGKLSTLLTKPAEIRAGGFLSGSRGVSRIELHSITLRTKTEPSKCAIRPSNHSGTHLP
jgi:hypothetical protein